MASKPTPEKWLKTQSLDQLFSLLPLKSRSPRKCRLYYFAGCRAVGTLWSFPGAHQIIQVASDMVEGKASPHAIAAARNAVADELAKLPPFEQYEPVPGTFLDLYGYCHAFGTLRPLQIMLKGTPKLAWEFSQRSSWHSDVFDIRQHHYLSEIVREIFTAAALGYEWTPLNSPELPRIASHMCELNDFTGMPMLADALGEAGCAAEKILAHCRDPYAVHVRGCWVVDLVLGKS